MAKESGSSLMPMLLAITGRKDGDEADGSSGEGTGHGGTDRRTAHIDHRHVVALLKHGKATIHHDDGSSTHVGVDYSGADKHFEAGMKGFKDAYENSAAEGQEENPHAVENDDEENDGSPNMSGTREVSR